MTANSLGLIARPEKNVDCKHIGAHRIFAKASQGSGYESDHSGGICISPMRGRMCMYLLIGSDLKWLDWGGVLAIGMRDCKS